MSGCIVSSVDIVIVDIDIAYFTVSTIFVLFIYPLAIPATKESPAPAASSELAEQAADPAFSENNLTPEELQMVNEFSQKIDLHNSQAILQYGVGTEKNG